MKMTIVFFLLILLACNTEETVEKESQSYFNLGSVKDTPEKFGSGSISTSSAIEFGVVYDKMNSDLYFTRLNPSNGKMFIYVMHQVSDNKWEEPKIAPFSGAYRDACPSVVNNGEKIFFTSYRSSDYSRIWYIERNLDKSWKEPNILTMPDSIQKDIRNIWFISDSVFYFDMEYGNSNNDIFRGLIRNNLCVSIKHTGPKINSSNPDIEAVVDPNEKYMIFYSVGRNGHLGSTELGDLYISYNEDGEWTTPVNMGMPINSTSEENWPTIDFENNVLYFSSNRSNPNHFPDVFWVKLDNYIDLNVNK